MDLLNLEQQRQTLEANLQKLRESLRHWQRLEAEYEGLKEEISTSKNDLTSEELTNIAKSYDGELVNEKEILELSGLDKGSPRSSTQIIGLVERRQEYVQKNIETVQRQFFDAEAKSEELAFAAANQSPGVDGGLPLTEIYEELDDDGNVISSRLSQPEESTANIIASLRKAGLKEDDLDDTTLSRPRSEDLKPAITNASPPITPSATSSQKRGSFDATTPSRTSSSGAEDLERPSIRKKSVSFTADTKPPEERRRPESEDGRKSVSFAEKVAVMPAAPPPDTRSVSFSPMVEEIPAPPSGPVSPDMAPKIEGSTPTQPSEALKSAVRNAEHDESGGAENEAIILPEDESPEDAKTRREMLEYHLNEVGNVVAQIDLEDPDVDMNDDEDDNSSFHTTSEYLDDDDTPYTTGLSESEDSEDEFGRTKRRVITPEYRKQMEDLHQRLIGNLGPEPKEEDIVEADPDLDSKDVRRLVVRDKRNSISSASSDNSEKKAGSKKRVSFAESVDVADPGSPPLKAQKHQEGENVAPMTSTVIERATATSHSLPQRISNEAVSRFKQDRTTSVLHSNDETAATSGSAIDDMDVDDPPVGPPGVTIADTLTERTPTSKPAVAPSAAGQDPLMDRRELATEYYRQRNELIHQQGGFTKAATDEDDGQGELLEERDGKLKKVSRFKAARIQP